MTYTAAVITVSDKGSRGERVDTSGPALCAILRERGWEIAHTAIVPDELELIKNELVRCSDELGVCLVLTTGGTGFSPRDVTPEATAAVIERSAPGIPEAMRAESMRITPRGCLSRESAGIRGKTLIVNLPGSEKAARENLLSVVDALGHGTDILRSSGSADCGGNTHHHHAPHHERHRHDGPPSLDEWLSQARTEPGAEKCGMYLTHCGTVRQSARARVREGDESTAPVRGMLFSYDAEKMRRAVDEALAMDGIYFVRAWLAEGELAVGDDIMRVLIGGDIRPHVIDALQALVGKLKNECVSEQEIF